MNRHMLGRAALTSLALGLATIACTPHAGLRPAALSGPSPKAAEMAAKQATKARAALSGSKGDVAVSFAENAVALMPRDAGYRMLLGQSYLAAGRFASAETSFRDTLTLKDDQPKGHFDLALAQIAQGHGQDAQAGLRALAGAIPATDLGLALTLSGDHAGGIQMLTDAVRTPGATSRTRQNLALALALDSRWDESRALAMQDTPPDRIEQQLADWHALAGPQAGPRQIAAMLGVTPVADAGLPTQLALAPPVVPPVDAAPVALASADPVPAAAAAKLAPITPNTLTVPLAAPDPVTPPMLAKQEAAGSVTVPLDAAAPSATPVPATPVLLASAKAPATPALLRAPKAAFRRAVQIVPVTHRGNYVVQLGAFARSGAVEAAWSKVSRMAPTLASYSPSRGSFKVNGTAMSRLSITGFETRAGAQKVCGLIKARGGVCFVRMSAGDAPLEWVRRDDATQVAQS